MIPPHQSFNENWVKSISMNDFIVFMLDHNTKYSETDLKGIYNSIVPHAPVTAPIETPKEDNPEQEYE